MNFPCKIVLYFFSEGLQAESIMLDCFVDELAAMMITELKFMKSVDIIYKQTCDCYCYYH